MNRSRLSLCLAAVPPIAAMIWLLPNGAFGQRQSFVPDKEKLIAVRATAIAEQLEKKQEGKKDSAYVVALVVTSKQSISTAGQRVPSGIAIDVAFDVICVEGRDETAGEIAKFLMAGEAYGTRYDPSGIAHFMQRRPGAATPTPTKPFDPRLGEDRHYRVIKTFPKSELELAKGLQAALGKSLTELSKTEFPEKGTMASIKVAADDPSAKFSIMTIKGFPVRMEQSIRNRHYPIELQGLMPKASGKDTVRIHTAAAEKTAEEPKK